MPYELVDLRIRALIMYHLIGLVILCKPRIKPENILLFNFPSHNNFLAWHGALILKNLKLSPYFHSVSTLFVSGKKKSNVYIYLAYIETM